MQEPPAAALFLDENANESEPHGTMSALSAVETLLSAVATPLSYLEITRLIIERKLWKTEGKTPDATINAQLAVDIKRHGSKSRFQRTGPGIYALRSWALDEYIEEPKEAPSNNTHSNVGKSKQPVVEPGLAELIQQHNRAVYQELHARLYNMSPTEFEHLIGELLIALGFEDAAVTQRSSDGGIDVLGTLIVGGVIRTKMAVQVKRWKHNVQAPTVQQVRGSLGTHDQGLIITTSNFSSGAYQEAERANAIPVALMNGEQLVRLLVENNMGVRRTSHDLFELEDPKIDSEAD